MFLRVDRDLINGEHVVRITESGHLWYFELTNGKSVSCRKDAFADGATPQSVLASTVPAPPGFLLLRPTATEADRPEVDRIEVVAFLVDPSAAMSDRVTALGFDGTRGPAGDIGLMSPSGSVRVEDARLPSYGAYLDHIALKKIARHGQA
jgi:hypothetical protein